MSLPSDIVLTAEAMRTADEATIREFGIPGFTLMETAGRATCDRIETHFGAAASQRVAVFCGRGNNGGDGLVIARTLLARGADVTVVMATGTERLSDDTKNNYGLVTKLAEIHPARCRFRDSPEAIPACDWWIDALLGTGLSSAPREPVAAWINWINTRRGPVIAVDVPSGLESDLGSLPGAVVHADLTVTMAAWKSGLLFGDGPSVSGQVDVVEIGIPAHVLELVSTRPGCGRLSSDERVRTSLRSRPMAHHKYSSGPTVVIAGSRQYPGAALLAATAAARIGSGYVTLAAPEDAREALEDRLVEIPFVGFEADQDPIATLSPALTKAKSVVLGPGLGRGPAVTELVRMLTQRIDVPMVIDADGLFALAELEPARVHSPWVLTPHDGEFARLTGVDLEPTVSRISQAAELAARWNAVVLLKGFPSVVVAPDGRAVICATGNASLATAGTGDVLAGFCGGLLATGLNPFDAAVAAVHIGGATADSFVHGSGRRSMMATDLLRQVGRVLRSRFE